MSNIEFRDGRAVQEREAVEFPQSVRDLVVRSVDLPYSIHCLVASLAGSAPPGTGRATPTRIAGTNIRRLLDAPRERQDDSWVGAQRLANHGNDRGSVPITSRCREKTPRSS